MVVSYNYMLSLVKKKMEGSVKDANRPPYSTRT